MKQLEIQKFLRNWGTIAELENEPYYLKVKRHKDYSNLYQFTYDQIESPKAHPIVREARGLILDSYNDWKVVAFPFTRFYNLGETVADQIDWNSEFLRVQEKVDGTLIIFYYYDDKWRVATKGSPDASGPVGDFKFMSGGVLRLMTFEDLFWQSAEHWLHGLNSSGIFSSDYTYLFELTSGYNRVVCNYSDSKYVQDGYANDGSRITLIGVRNNITLKEVDVELFRGDFHYVVKQFPLNSVEDVVKAAADLNPLKQEGFVVVDGKFNRVKIKSPQYVVIHHLRDGSPRRRMVELIKSGEQSEVEAYNLLDEWPEEKKMYEEMRFVLNRIILQSESFYDTIKESKTQKEFALEAVKSPLSGALFSLRKGSVKSIRQFVLNMPADKLLDLIDSNTVFEGK